MLKISEDHAGQTVALFTSGGPVRAALMSVMGIPADTWAGWASWNTGLSELQKREDRWRVIRYNDTGHLLELTSI